MRLSSEALLMLLALALYLYDALYLLGRNEALLVRTRGGWRAAFGAFDWRLAGKEPYLPNPFTPHRPVVRLAWQFDGTVGAGLVRQVELQPQLRGLGWLTGVSAATLFVLLPASLFAHWGTLATLLVVGLLYGVNLAALVLLYRQHRRAAVPARRYWSTAFECLVCPPFCLNLVRRAYAWAAPDEDFLAASQRLLPPAQLQAVRANCLRRIDEQIAFEDEQGSRMAALQRARERFLPRDAST